MRHDQTDFVILGLLNHEPMTGYDIKKRIDQTIRYFWNAGFGQIYPALKRLEDKQLVVKEIIPGEKNPDRKVYEITHAGREVLLDWLKKPASREYLRFEILLKLFFGSELEPAENLSVIHNFKDRYKKFYDTMLSFEKDLQSTLADSPDHLYYLLTVLFGKRLYSAYIEWADEASVLINKIKLKKRRKSL